MAKHSDIDDSNNIVELYKNLHDKIISFLDENDLSVYWLSKRTGIPNSTLHKKLNNYTLTPDMMEKIHQVFINFDESISGIFKK